MLAPPGPNALPRDPPAAVNSVTRTDFEMLRKRTDGGTERGPSDSRVF
jgi:hypothetical protein